MAAKHLVVGVNNWLAANKWGWLALLMAHNAPNTTHNCFYFLIFSEWPELLLLRYTFCKGTTWSITIVQVICHFGITLGEFIVSMVMMLRYVKNKWSNPGKRMAENDLFPVKTFYNHGGKFSALKWKKKNSKPFPKLFTFHTFVLLWL